MAGLVTKLLTPAYIPSRRSPVVYSSALMTSPFMSGMRDMPPAKPTPINRKAIIIGMSW
jgi:hypothetical protein